MTAEDVFGRAARLHQRILDNANFFGSVQTQNFGRGSLNALLVEEPLSHLPKEFNLVVLVERPTHVKDVGHCLTIENFEHEGTTAMKGVAAGKVVFGARKNLDAQTVHASVLLQQGHERDLVTARGQDQITGQQKGIEKVSRAVIGPYIVKSGIGRVRCIVQGMIAAVPVTSVKCVSDCTE
jgi:hypothetical protein